jgi:hypothetical protein
MSVISVSFAVLLSNVQLFLPFDASNRKDFSLIKLTQIGEFGMLRKPRPNVPAHYHAGIDIKRPHSNYSNEPIYPIANGKVISKREDGPFANIIIEHEFNGLKFWTVYEHIAGVKVKVNDQVSAYNPIARFMSKPELDKHGWQFDHFHLEVLKRKPVPLQHVSGYPERFYNSYSLVCFSYDDLIRYYYNPLEFFKEYL